MTTLAGLLLKQGDDYTETLTITDAAGAAVDLTGTTLTFHLRAPGGTTDAITPAPTLALTTPASGIATLALTDTQTAALTAGLTYTYEVEMVDGTGLISTPVEGLALVTGDLG
jgi:hypothetical protein